MVTLLVSALCLYFFMISKLQLMKYLGAKYLSVYYTVSSPLNCWWDFSVLIKFVEVEDGIVLIVLPCIFVTIRALCFQNLTWPMSILLITGFLSYILSVMTLWQNWKLCWFFPYVVQVWESRFTRLFDDMFMGCIFYSVFENFFKPNIMSYPVEHVLVKVFW